MIRSALLMALGATSTNAMRYSAALSVVAERYDISTPRRVAAFVSQLAHESARFTRTEENLSYSADGLARTWPKRYRGADGQPNDDAIRLAHKPEAIATYGSRNGNRGLMSGDGWKFRGRGLLQITGRANYSQCSDALRVDLMHNPDVLLSPLYASLSAGWYWHTRELNAPADAGDVRGVTRAINGGLHGLEDRQALYDFARAALGGM